MDEDIFAHIPNAAASPAQGGQDDTAIFAHLPNATSSTVQKTSATAQDSGPAVRPAPGEDVGYGNIGLPSQKSGPSHGGTEPSAAPAPSAYQFRDRGTPNVAERMTSLGEATGGVISDNPAYWRRVVYEAKFPERLYTGATDLPGQIAQGIPHAGSFVTSLGGYAPNPVSNYIGEVAAATDKRQAAAEAARRQEAANAGHGGETEWAREIGGMIPGGSGELISAFGKGGNFIQKAFRASAVGGMYGYGQAPDIQPGEDWTKAKGYQTALGAGAGPLIEGGGNALAKVVGPWATENAQKFIEAGGTPTIGQTLGGNVLGVENLAKRLMGAGAPIDAAQQRANDSLRRAALNQPLERIGDKLPEDIGTGHEAQQYVQQAFSNAYDNTIPKMQGFYDPSLRQGLNNVVNDAAQNMLPDRVSQLQKILDGNFSLRGGSANGQYTGEQLQAIDQSLRTQGQQYAKAQDPDQQQLGQALLKARDEFHAMLADYNPVEFKRLQEINRGYAEFMPARKAAAGVAAEGGEFSPAQYHNRVVMGDNSAGRMQSAQGNALMQDLSGPAKATLNPGRTSGTAENAFNTAGLLEAIHNPVAILPSVATGLAASAGIYSAPVQNALRSLAAGDAAGRAGLSNAIRGAMPAVNAAYNTYGDHPRSEREWQAKYENMKHNAAIATMMGLSTFGGANGQ
jgi:hypothetical protein